MRYVPRGMARNGAEARNGVNGAEARNGVNGAEAWNGENGAKARNGAKAGSGSGDSRWQRGRGGREADTATPLRTARQVAAVRNELPQPALQCPLPAVA